MQGLCWSLESERHAEKHSLTTVSDHPHSWLTLLPAGRSRYVSDAIESGKPLLIVRNGAGPLHIAVKHGTRVLTRCGKEFPADKVTLFKTKTAVTGVWANWDHKCNRCRAGIL